MFSVSLSNASKAVKEVKMKRVVVVCVALLASGVLFLSYSAVGTTVPGTETVALFGGACTQFGEGTVNICYGGNCSGNGCGCTTRQPFRTGETGAHPDPTTRCGSSDNCTAPQTLSGTCSAGA
jgi:hypothetical protein